MAKIIVADDERGIRERLSRTLHADGPQVFEAAEGLVFWITDKDLSKMIYISPAYEQVWGRSRESLYAHPETLRDTLFPEDSEWALLFPKIRQQGEKLDVEYRIRRPDGEVRWIRNRGFPIRDESGEISRFTGFAEDITEHKVAEERLRKSEAQLAEAQHLARLGSWDWDIANDKLTWSDELYRILGAEPGGIRISYDTVADRVHPDDKLDYERVLKQAGERGKPYSHEFRFIGYDGAVRVFHSKGAVVKNQAGEAVRMFGTSQDVTEQAQMERDLRESQTQLRALADRLLAAREEEATRIAREIHDDLGQCLTSLKLDATWLQEQLGVLCKAPLGRHLFERLDGMVRLVDATIERTRKICIELRPGVLDELGLVAALEWQAQEFEAHTGVFCNLSLPASDPPLSPQSATTVFRIFQEVLTNIARHSGATEVDVRLEATPGAMTLRVADNGRGISESEIANATGLGLVGMRERALAAGGSVSICGKPGEGTTIILRLKIDHGDP